MFVKLTLSDNKCSFLNNDITNLKVWCFLSLCVCMCVFKNVLIVYEKVCVIKGPLTKKKKYFKACKNGIQYLFTS